MMEFNKHYCKYYGIKLVVCYCVQIGPSKTKTILRTKDTMALVFAAFHSVNLI